MSQVDDEEKSTYKKSITNHDEKIQKMYNVTKDSSLCFQGGCVRNKGCVIG